MEVRLLDAKKILISRDAFEQLRIEIAGEEPRENVQPARCFPTTNPTRYISLLQDGQEIGVLPELDRLEPHSRRVLEEELDRVYFTPIIQRIVSVSSQHGATTWRLDTDRGETTVYVKDRAEIRRLPGRRILFTDVHGMKFDLPDYTKLDERSRTLLENEI